MPPQNDSLILSAAIVQLAESWSIGSEQLASILGLPLASAIELIQGRYKLDTSGPGYKAALLLIRLFGSLDVIFGGDDPAPARWLSTFNLDLGAAPMDRMASLEGLAAVCDYLDGQRARS